MRTIMNRRLSVLEERAGMTAPVRRIFLWGDEPEPEGLEHLDGTVELVRVVWVNHGAPAAEGAGS